MARSVVSDICISMLIYIYAYIYTSIYILYKDEVVCLYAIGLTINIQSFYCDGDREFLE